MASEHGESFFRRLGGTERLTAAAWFAGVVLVLAVALWLTPDERGLGTHEQLGLAPCRMLTYFHIPCPFCGMTTSFSLMVRFQFWNAFRAHPAGVVLFIITLITGIAALICAVAGRGPRAVPRFLASRTFMLSVFSILVSAWLYKIGDRLFL